MIPHSGQGGNRWPSRVMCWFSCMINLNGVWHSRHVTISFRAARDSFFGGGCTTAIFSTSSSSSRSSFRLRFEPARVGVTLVNSEKGAMGAVLCWTPLLRFLVLVLLLLLLLLLWAALAGLLADLYIKWQKLLKLWFKYIEFFLQTLPCWSAPRRQFSLLRRLRCWGWTGLIAIRDVVHWMLKRSRNR